MIAEGQEILLACHFRHACHRFVSPDLYRSEGIVVVVVVVVVGVVVQLHSLSSEILKTEKLRKPKVFHGGRLHTKARVSAKHAPTRHNLNPHHAGVLRPGARN
jgi:hypothetical protein